MSSPAPLPRTLMIGIHRARGLQLLPTLSPHLDIVAIVGGHPSPFLAETVLAPALRAIHPPVQVLTIGGAYTDEDAAAAKKVWDAYRAEVDGRPEEYGAESGARVGFVRVPEGEIKAGRERGAPWEEMYEIIRQAFLGELDKL